MKKILAVFKCSIL